MVGSVLRDREVLAKSVRTMAASDIGSARHQYDVVEAITQRRVNASLDALFHASDLGQVQKAWVYGASGPEETDFSELVKETGVDPFSIAHGTATSDPQIQALMGKKFMFAFQGSVNSGHLRFNKGTSAATFSVTCSTLDIAIFEPGGYGGGSWSLFQQGSGQLAIDFSVELGLVPADESTLSEELRAVLKKTVDAPVQAQHAVAKLSSATLVANPDVPGFSKTDTAFVFFTSTFLPALVNSVASLTPEGHVVLALGITSQGHNLGGGAIPASLQMVVSPYVGEDGAATDHFDSYTLCLCGGTQLQPPTAFSWNWVPEGETDYNGTVAVGRGVLSSTLGKLLSGSLAHVLFEPHASISVSLDGFDVSHCKLTPVSEAHTFENAASPALLQFVLDNSTHASGKKGTNWAKVTLATHFESSVRVTGSQIVVTSRSRVHLEVSAVVATSSSDVVDLRTSIAYGVRASEGRAAVIQMGKVSLEDASSFDPDHWGVIGKVTDVSDVVTRFKDTISVAVASFGGGFEEQLSSAIESSCRFLYPGNEPTHFTASQISSAGDLVFGFM